MNTKNTMVITIESSLNSDGFGVTITDSLGSSLFNQSYRYGHNASYDRAFAEQARIEHEKWGNGKHGSYYCLKPYVSDIIEELCAKYGINVSDIQYKAGKNVFRGDSVDDEKVKGFIARYISSLGKDANNRYYRVDFRVFTEENGKVANGGQGEVTTYSEADFEKNCNGSLIKDFVAYDSLLAQAIQEMGIKDCAYLGWERPLGFVAPVKPVKHFPKSVVSYVKALSNFYLSFGLKEIGGCECYIKDQGSDKILARFASTDGLCVDFKFTEEGQSATFEDVCEGLNLSDLSDEAVQDVYQIQKLLSSVINESIDLVHGMIEPDVNIDWVNFCFTPRKELGKKWMLGITNVPGYDESFYESDIKSGTMRKGTLVLHYIFGV